MSAVGDLAAALREFRARVAAPYWSGRIVEMLAGLTGALVVLTDFRDEVEGTATALKLPDDQASAIASEALERHYLCAQAYLEKLRRELRFCVTGCEDAAARKVDARFGNLCAPSLSESALKLHFGSEEGAEVITRWRALLAAVAPTRARKAA